MDLYKKNKTTKISFIGDIMCEKPLLNAAKIKENKYDFNFVFKNMKHQFSESDYIVGNLETVFAGENQEYTNHIYSFNTPDEFAKAIKDSGIDLVTTANNHCLDRGITGLKRTISVLEETNLDHIGTYRTEEERNKLFIKEFNGLKISFLNYTYGTNLQENKVVLKESQKYHVNILKSQESDKRLLEQRLKSPNFKQKVFKQIFKHISVEKWIKFKKNFGLPANRMYQDNSLDSIDKEILENIRKDIDRAKENSDFVVFHMHSGGQFNEMPGEFSKYMMNFISESGADVIIGTHPHVVQNLTKVNQSIGVYSLGNFNISPSSVYLVPDHLPEYGIIFHLYINKKDLRQVEEFKIGFSIIKMVESERKYLTVYNIKDIYDKSSIKEKEQIQKDATVIYNRFLNSNHNLISIQKEYKI